MKKNKELQVPKKKWKGLAARKRKGGVEGWVERAEMDVGVLRAREHGYGKYRLVLELISNSEF